MAHEGGHHGAAHRLGVLYLGPGKYGGPGAGNRTSEGAGRHGAALHLLETGYQGMTLRLDDHVVEGVANHLQIVRIATADETRQIRRLPDEIRARDIALQPGAGP